MINQTNVNGQSRLASWLHLESTRGQWHVVRLLKEARLYGSDWILYLDDYAAVADLKVP